MLYKLRAGLYGCWTSLFRDLIKRHRFFAGVGHQCAIYLHLLRSLDQLYSETEGPASVGHFIRADSKPYGR